MARNFKMMAGRKQVWINARNGDVNGEVYNRIDAGRMECIRMKGSMSAIWSETDD